MNLPYPQMPKIALPVPRERSLLSSACMHEVVYVTRLQFKLHVHIHVQHMCMVEGYFNCPNHTKPTPADGQLDQILQLRASTSATK